MFRTVPGMIVMTIISKRAHIASWGFASVYSSTLKSLSRNRNAEPLNWHKTSPVIIIDKQQLVKKLGTIGDAAQIKVLNTLQSMFAM